MKANDKRHLLSKQMVRGILMHFSRLDGAILKAYTFEKRHSDYPDTSADFDIFDERGNLAFQGREFRGGPAAYWRQSGVTTAPGLD